MITIFFLLFSYLNLYPCIGAEDPIPIESDIPPLLEPYKDIFLL